MFNGFCQKSGYLTAVQRLPVFYFITASPVIGAEGFIESVRPYFYPAVSDHGELCATVQLLKDIPEFIRIAAAPVHKYINAFKRLHCLFSLVGRHLHYMIFHEVSHIQNPWFKTEPGDNRLRKLFGSCFL